MGRYGGDILRAVRSGDRDTCIPKILNHALAHHGEDDDSAQFVIRRLALTGRGGFKQSPIARGFGALALACGNDGLC